MRVAYLTTDVVNEQLALQMAATCGLALYPLAPKDRPRGEAFEAVLYDWDYLPAREQQEVLAELLAGGRSHGAALHGYNLEDDQVEALCRHTVAVYRCLQ